MVTKMQFWDNKNILITGGAGFLGSFLTEKLLAKGVRKENIRIPRSKDLDLRQWEGCTEAVEGMDIVIHLAARVGGIGYNQKYPANLFFDNAMMGIQLIEAARLAGVNKFVEVGTICAYPKYTPVPFKENELWNGYPEETYAPYGLAKKMLLVQTQAYRQQYGFNGIYLLPVNLYGPRDNFHPEHSHVIPAIIRKVVVARDNGDRYIEAWGNGSASREFLYVEDAAEGILLASEKYEKADPVNLGSGREITIKDLITLISDLAGYDGEVHWDTSKPDGQPRRCLDVSRAEKEFDFRSKTSFEDGLRNTISWYEKAAAEGLI